jgi:hypothetical protein
MSPSRHRYRPRPRIVASASVALVAGLVNAATATWVLTHPTPAKLQPVRFAIVPPAGSKS